jgi:hypothetical protein
VLGFTALRAQVNLVPNYSFEDIDTCYFAFDQVDVTSNWFSPNLSTPDIYNKCAIVDGSGVPSNAFGFQYAQDSIGYSGILLYVPSIYNYREYIGVKLNTSLVQGQRYCLKFYVSLSEQYSLTISSIGMFLSVDSLFQNNLKVLPYTPQFENSEVNFINDTTSWQLIKGNITANGGEQYLYIGNFKTDSNTVVQGFTPGARSYVYIDNVQLYECDSLIGVNELQTKPLKIYPNPTKDFVSIELPKNSSQAELSIYNLTGQLIFQKQIIQPNQTIPITELGNGMYIFVVESGDRVVGRERVVISK